MTKLTEVQASVLTPALARYDGCIFPIVAPLKGGAVGNIARSLLRRGFIEEVAAAENATVWRCGDDGAILTLQVTAAGRQVAGGGDPVSSGQAVKSPVEPMLVPVDVQPRQHGSRQRALLGLLSRPEGATIRELQEATGWQAHSVRGALSGIMAKKLGHEVTSGKEGDRGRVYRIHLHAAPDADRKRAASS